MTPDLRAVQKASTEAQARVKRENARHTLGPWEAKPTGPWDGWDGWSVEDAAGSVVCDAHGSQFNGAREANARLIAAAPELLDALQIVVTNWTSQFERRGHMAPDWCKKARLAIAKATGEPT